MAGTLLCGCAGSRDCRGPTAGAGTESKPDRVANRRFIPDFPVLLAIQKKHALQGRLETNGLRITPELAARLADSGVDHVSVSLDGARPETHDAIRGVPGAWQRAVAGIGHLVTAGYRPQLIMSSMCRNVAELEDVLTLAGQLGAGSVKFNVAQPTCAAMSFTPRANPVGGRTDRVEPANGTGTGPRVPFPIYFDVPMAFRSLRSILANGSHSAASRPSWACWRTAVSPVRHRRQYPGDGVWTGGRGRPG